MRHLEMLRTVCEEMEEDKGTFHYAEIELVYSAFHCLQA